MVALGTTDPGTVTVARRPEPGGVSQSILRIGGVRLAEDALPVRLTRHRRSALLTPTLRLSHLNRFPPLRRRVSALAFFELGVKGQAN